MAKITNDVLAEKIDNLHKDVIDMKPEVKLNSEFRIKSTGIYIGIATAFSAVGVFISIIVNKLMEKF